MVRLRSLILVIFFFLAGCGAVRVEPASPTSPGASPTAATPATLTAPPTPSLTVTVTLTATPTRATIIPTATATSTQTVAPTPPPGPLCGTAVIEALRSGCYVIYFRHAATDPIPDDANPVVLDDCSTQRNLSAAGQAQAGEIGLAFQRLGIPVGRVLASPFCRALDTARLAFGRVKIERSLENLETSPDDAEREKRTGG
ncbi:MAG: hypothetical protein EHM21_18245, partial [Chloroflexi bacterium]